MSLKFSRIFFLLLLLSRILISLSLVRPLVNPPPHPPLLKNLKLNRRVRLFQRTLAATVSHFQRAFHEKTF